MHQDIEIPQREIPFRVGESVRIIDGPFQDFEGEIARIDDIKERAVVIVPWNPKECRDGEFIPLYESPQELRVELDLRQIDCSL
ncbi:MAG: transcription termination/antitermination protein NusG [Thermomicrobiales bacterium]